MRQFHLTEDTKLAEAQQQIAKLRYTHAKHLMLRAYDLTDAQRRSNALLSWREFAARKATIRNICHKVVMRLQNKTLACAFEALVSFARTSVSLQVRLGQSAHSRRRLTLRSLRGHRSSSTILTPATRSNVTCWEERWTRRWSKKAPHLIPQVRQVHHQLSCR